MQISIQPFINRIVCGDAKEVLKRMPNESVDCVVTSPPYWGLRDYGGKGQIGLEITFQEYIAKLCAVFDEVKRVLKESGSCWVNLGDTYYTNHSHKGYGRKLQIDERQRSVRGHAQTHELPGKSLCQIPSRFAVEMASRGWILRNELIWWKPNAMPESVKDSCERKWKNVQL
jgi:site-specific DNA-methyltransferase (cytosine-N4-specific)